MLLDFLRSRPDMDGILKEPTRHTEGGLTFYRHEVQFYPYLAEPWRAKRYHRRRLRKNWKRSFHWTRFHYIYSILLYGLKDSTTHIKGVLGAYSHEHILRGTYYQCYTHMPDGVCYCVCCEIDIDDTWPVTKKPWKSTTCNSRRLCAII